MFKKIKDARDFFPWYLRPTYLMEIVPEIIKDKNNQETGIKSTKEFKFGLEEVMFGIGIFSFLFVVRFYI